MRLGVTDYIVKPIVTHNVLDRLLDVIKKMQSASSEETKPQLDSNRSPVLMVVDQDNKFCNLFSSAVGRTHQVIEATNGAQALSLALKNPPDAIFLGESLGAFSRRGVVRKIRELPAKSQGFRNRRRNNPQNGAFVALRRHHPQSVDARIS